MNVMVACERSGVVREAFRKRGHNAISVDLEPAEDGSRFHIQGDARMAVRLHRPDLLIAHPECRYMSNSGVLRLYKSGKKVNGRDEKRWYDMEQAAFFFKFFLVCEIERVAIENPIMHGYAKAIIGVEQTQIVQPYDFGDDASKATCLWLRNLPPLRPTKYIPPRMVNGKPRWANQTDSGQNKLTPSDTRSMDRARTYRGIADAMAEQWGGQQ